MGCHEEFPATKITYTLTTGTAFVLIAARMSSALGPWGLGGFLVALLFGLCMTLGTVCTRCGYYGRRCATGLGRIVPLVFPRGRTDGFCQTGAQRLSLACLAAAPLLAVAGAGRLLLMGHWGWPLLLASSALAILLPHPWWICRFCVQQEHGHCPVGRVLVRRTRTE